MKKMIVYTSLLLLTALTFSCKKDSASPPSSLLSGRFVYQGTPIGVEIYAVPFEMYQYGFGKLAPIGGSLTQDGTYSQMLFDGDYKLIVRNGQGPFIWPTTAGGAPDTVDITMNGSQTLDIEVTPYYLVTNPQFTVSGSNVIATFGAQKVITDANAKNIEYAVLLINKTQFLANGSNYNLGRTTIAGADITDMNNISLSVAVPTVSPTQNYMFVRVGLKMEGVEDLIMSPATKVNL